MKYMSSEITVSTVTSLESSRRPFFPLSKLNPITTQTTSFKYNSNPREAMQCHSKIARNDPLMKQILQMTENRAMVQKPLQCNQTHYCLKLPIRSSAYLAAFGQPGPGESSSGILRATHFWLDKEISIDDFCLKIIRGPKFFWLESIEILHPSFSHISGCYGS